MLTLVGKRTEPLNISLPDFDKGHRCPGWSGEGWKFNKVNWCNDELAPGERRWALTVRRGARRSDVEDAVDLPGFYAWRVRRTNCCNTIVLPQWTMYLAPRSWSIERASYGGLYIGPAWRRVARPFQRAWWRIEARWF